MSSQDQSTTPASAQVPTHTEVIKDETSSLGTTNALPQHDRAKTSTGQEAGAPSTSTMTLDGPSTAAEPSAMPDQIVEVMLDLKYRWSGTIYEISVAESDTVGDMKALIFSQTTIPVERQKILSLVKGKLPDDDTVLAQLKLSDRAGKEFSVLGTPIGKELQASLYNGPADALNEQDVEQVTSLKMDDPALKRRNARKLLEAVNKLNVNIMNEPRPGKKLLVLDLDYTILDTHAWKSQNFHAIDYQRPGLHEFLTAVYPHYDIVIWSQTSWMWLESKLIELNMVGETQTAYKIAFVLDRTPMFSVYSVRHGKPFKHEVKALEIIWRKFPQFYNAANSIHIDDLGRNFVLNPQQGLKISAYKDASKHRHTDRELPALAKYLVAISKLDSLESLDHAQWKSYPVEEQ